MPGERRGQGRHMRTAALDLEQGAPRVYHHLQLNGADGTSLKETHFSRFQGIRHWLNTTILYGPVLSAVRRWFWDIGHREMRYADEEKTWLAWLTQHKVSCTKAQVTEVARDMKNAFSVSRADYVRPLPRVPQGAKLLSRGEYLSAEGNEDIPLWGDDPAFGKVAASGRSSSLINLDWMARGGPSSWLMEWAVAREVSTSSRLHQRHLCIEGGSGCSRSGIL